MEEKDNWLQFIAKFTINEMLGFKKKYRIKSFAQFSEKDVRTIGFILSMIYNGSNRIECKKLIEEIFEKVSKQQEQ